MRIYKVNEWGLGEKCHLLPLQVWKNLLEANCLPQEQSMAGSLQEHDRNSGGCWVCYSSIVTHWDICYHKFQFSKPIHFIFTEWEKWLSFVCFWGKLTFTLSYMNPSNPYLRSFIIFLSSLLDTSTLQLHMYVQLPLYSLLVSILRSPAA